MARSWQVLLVTSVGVFMTFLDVTIVNIAFPDIRESFPTSSLPQLSWILNVYAIVFAAALVPAGRLADRFGRRRFFFRGLFLFLAASAVCGAAGSVERADRGARGAGAAVERCWSPHRSRSCCPSSRSSDGRQRPPSGVRQAPLPRRRPIARWAARRLAGLARRLLRQPPDRHTRAVPARRLLRESREPQTAFPDALGALLFAAGWARSALGIVEGPSGVGAPRASSVRSSPAPAPCGRPPAVKPASGPGDRTLALPRPFFAVANAGNFVFAVGFFGLLLCNVLFLTGVWHYSTLGPASRSRRAPWRPRSPRPSGDDSPTASVSVSSPFPAHGLRRRRAVLRARDRSAPAYVRIPAGELAQRNRRRAHLRRLQQRRRGRASARAYSTGGAINDCFRQIGAVIGISA